MRTRLLLVRHAEAEGNASRHFHGWTDSPLTEKGHIQAKLAAKRLINEKIDVIYSSTLKRTMQTAGYISEIKDLPIIRTDKLKEINGGDWEGKGWDELDELFPDEYHTWENEPHNHIMPNGEAMDKFQQRIVKEIMYIIDNNKGKNICVVTHGTAIKTLMCFFKGCDLEEMLNIPWYDNTSLTIVEFYEDKFDIILEGDATHLDRDTSTLENQEWWIEAKSKLGKTGGKNIE